MVFIYLGENGTRSVDWKNLDENKDCFFITRDPIHHPGQSMSILDESFSYYDLMASSDITLTKGGYSTLAATFANHKPVATCERNDFFEFEAIQEYLLKNKIGILIKDKAFYNANWQESIKDALKLTVKDKVPLNGEIETANIIRQILS